jgi:hypothetical protein
LLVQYTERLLASVAGSAFKISLPTLFRGTAELGKKDKGIGRLTLPVESDSGAGEMVFSVVTNTKIITTGGKRRFFLVFC